MIELAGRILTEDNRDLLKIIYNYGGYIRTKHLAFLFPEISERSRIKKLDKLVEMKYLVKRRLKTDSKIEPVTYQVTQKTCKLFNNPDSYFRKKHNEEYAYRALLKSYFCCGIYKDLGDYLLADHKERIKLFTEGKFSEDTFPRKYNKDTPMIHFEELVFDFTKKFDVELKQKDEVIYTGTEPKAVIIYIDKYYIEVRHQITQIVNRYINMILAGGDFRVDILIVVDDKEREEIYKKEAKKFTDMHIVKRNNYDNSTIIDTALKYYKDFLMNYYEKNEDENKKKITDEQYKSGIFKRQILDKFARNNERNLSKNERQTLNEIERIGEKYIEEGMKIVFKNAGGFARLDAVKKEMDRYFASIFSIITNEYATRKCSNTVNKFEIKVYAVDEKIYA